MPPLTPLPHRDSAVSSPPPDISQAVRGGHFNAETRRGGGNAEKTTPPLPDISQAVRGGQFTAETRRGGGNAEKTTPPPHRDSAVSSPPPPPPPSNNPYAPDTSQLSSAYPSASPRLRVEVPATHFTHPPHRDSAVISPPPPRPPSQNPHALDISQVSSAYPSASPRLRVEVPSTTLLDTPGVPHA
jgi:hypothetical protein